MTTPLRLVSMDCSIDLASSYAESGVAEVLNQLDHDLIGLEPDEIMIQLIQNLSDT